MASTSEKPKTTSNDWAYLLLAAFFVISGALDLSRGDEALGATTYFIGAVALLCFYGAPRVGTKAVQWIGWAAFAAFLVLSIVDLFGLAS